MIFIQEFEWEDKWNLIREFCPNSSEIWWPLKFLRVVCRACFVWKNLWGSVDHFNIPLCICFLQSIDLCWINSWWNISRNPPFTKLFRLEPENWITWLIKTSRWTSRNKKLALKDFLLTENIFLLQKRIWADFRFPRQGTFWNQKR